MASSQTPPTLAIPPTVSTLRTEQGGAMERSLSQDIRDEREELREAAESTLNAIVDLNLDGTIRWASPSWSEVIGTRIEDVEGRPMSDLVVSDCKSIFSDVVDSMKRDDSRSHRVRFAVQLGPLSKLRSVYNVDDPDMPQPQQPEQPQEQPQEQPHDQLQDQPQDQQQGQPQQDQQQEQQQDQPDQPQQTPAVEPEPEIADLEAQGIMVYDSASGGESHVSTHLQNLRIYAGTAVYTTKP